MTTLHGKNAVVYLQGSGSVAEVITEAAEWQLSIDVETADDGAFGDTWVSMQKGRMSFSGSIAANFDTAANVLFDAVTATSSRKLYLYADRSSTSNYYYGTVFPKLSATVALGGVAKATVSFDGDGQLARN